MDALLSRYQGPGNGCRAPQDRLGAPDMGTVDDTRHLAPGTS